MNNNIEEIVDYIDSYFTIQMLSGCRIEKETSMINQYTELLKYKVFNFPITDIKLFLHEDVEHKNRDCMIITITKSWSFDGTQMRKKLLSKGIKKYKKTTSNNSHFYRFELQDLNQIETIFEVFKRYLPK